MKQDPPAESHEREREEEPRPRFTVNDRRFWTMEEQDLESEGTRPSQPSFVEQLERQLQDKDQQLREYIAAYKKEVVEGLEKTKERLERDASARIEQIRGQMAGPMIEVLEALERSILAAESGATAEAVLQGVRMVHLLMVQKLQELGLQRVATVGQPFDPSCHEAVAVIPVSEPARDNTIVAELRPGFTLGERLVRAAQVQVGKLG